MAGQYSHKHFFRHVPNHQFYNYFTVKAVDLGIDFSKLKEKEVDTIFIAFTALAEEQQAMIEAEFQNIHAMACEGGITALIDEMHFMMICLK